MSEAPVKARIEILDGKSAGTKIDCLFNPKEYTIEKTAEWTAPTGAGKNTSKLEFKSGKPATMKVELFFDTYEADEKDVSVHTKKIFDLMKVDKEKLGDPKSKKARPPKVLFIWGQNKESRRVVFQSVVQSVSAKYTLFLADGTPVRATLNVTFTQIDDSDAQAGQNPTSGGVGGESIWTVQQGESLGLIAYRTLGETSAWRRIADFNGLINVRRLAPGTVLVIPNA
jgi:Contractile injection system tube protein/LysM domain